MRKPSTLATIAIIFSGMFLLAACSSTKLSGNAKIEDRSIVPTKNEKPAETRAVETMSTVPTSLANEPQGILAKRSIYFDYDSFIIKDEFKPVIEAHAKYIAADKNRHVIIQGNTDERGGSEFNLALGQKRAEAVRKSLNQLGVPDSQLEAVSFGKEKPKALGSNETSWAENRRADITY